MTAWGDSLLEYGYFPNDAGGLRGTIVVTSKSPATNIGIREATSLADLDYVHQFAQTDAFESLAQDLGASVHGNRSFADI